MITIVRFRLLLSQGSTFIFRENIFQTGLIQCLKIPQCNAMQSQSKGNSIITINHKNMCQPGNVSSAHKNLKIWNEVLGVTMRIFFSVFWKVWVTYEKLLEVGSWNLTATILPYHILSRALVCGVDTYCVKPWNLNWLWLMNPLSPDMGIFFISSYLAQRDYVNARCIPPSPQNTPSHHVLPSVSVAGAGLPLVHGLFPLLLAWPVQTGPKPGCVACELWAWGRASQGQAGLLGQLRSSRPT